MDFHHVVKLPLTSSTFANFDKPMTCPHCGYGTDGVFRDHHIFHYEPGYFVVLCFRCTHCQKNFFAEYETPNTTSPLNLRFVHLFPDTDIAQPPELLSKLSPRFADLHNQAKTAESKSLIDIAAVGFRAALEVLVKEFAITELNEPAADVESKSLAAVIGMYLQQADLVKTADVVRILGNDYAHFKKSYPQHDFELLVRYYDIFLNLINTKLMILNPPVSRQP